MRPAAKIAVIGSYAVGMTMKCQKFPVGGETVPGSNFVIVHGGKGSNQAVAARRIGADVMFGVCVGNDDFGDKAVKLYADEQVDARHLIRSREGLATGVGIVIVNDEGENEIVIDFAANNELNYEDIDRMLQDMKECYLVLMQLEGNLDTVIYTSKRCSELGIPFVLNPAPFQPLPDALLKSCTYLTPNQTEARQILGLDPEDSINDENVARRIREKGVANVVMTLGESGAMLVNDEYCERIPGISVDTVDSTGAGDTFSAALCVALSEGKPIVEAIRFANVAAGLAVTKYGVIEGIPTREEIENYMEEQGLK